MSLEAQVPGSVHDETQQQRAKDREGLANSWSSEWGGVGMEPVFIDCQVFAANI